MQQSLQERQKWKFHSLGSCHGGKSENSLAWEAPTEGKSENSLAWGAPTGGKNENCLAWKVQIGSVVNMMFAPLVLLFWVGCCWHVQFMWQKTYFQST
jgi:hypothetical protein